MRNVFRYMVLLLAFSLCSLCVWADDVLPDGVSSSDLPGGSGEFTDMDDQSNSDSFELFDGDIAVDTLVVSDLIVESDIEAQEAAEAAAAAEIYSISPDVQYGAYFHADITDFGDSYVYIPVSYASDSFSYNSDGVPINITGSTITGYVAGSNSNQAIQFPSFGLPRYRVSNNYDYEYITSWNEIDSTVTVYTQEDNFYSYSDVYFLRFLVLLLAADLALNFILRLLGGFRT